MGVEARGQGHCAQGELGQQDHWQGLTREPEDIISSQEAGGRESDLPQPPKY